MTHDERVKQLADEVQVHGAVCTHPDTCADAILSALLQGNATRRQQQAAALVVDNVAGGLAETEADRQFAREIAFGTAAPPDKKVH